MRVDRPDENDGPAVGYEHRGADAPVVISEIRDRERYYIEYRAAVEAEYRAAREPWEAVAPSLREAWADHEKKWPLPERPGHSPRPEDPGAWHGDGGRYLSREASAEVEQGCEKIRDVGENIIMMAMRPIEAEDPRRNLIGLDYRLKGPDRLKEKVAGILDEQPELSHYSDGARADMDRLTERGFELAKPLKNS